MAAPSSLFDNPELVARALRGEARKTPDNTGITQALSSIHSPSIFDNYAQGRPITQAQRESALGIRPDQTDGFFSTVGDFIHSTASAAVPELLGFQPARNVERFRENHPGLGFASTLIGFAGPALIPYVGEGLFGTKLLQTLKKGDEIVKSAGALSNTFVRGAAVETLRWVPFQTARLGASVALSPFGASPKEVLGSIAIETPFIAGLGGLLAPEGFMASRSKAGLIGGESNKGAPRSEVKLSAQLPVEYSLRAPPQDKLNKLYGVRQEAGPAYKELQAEIDEVIAYYEPIVRRETPADAKKIYGRRARRTHVGTMVGKFLDPSEDGIAAASWSTTRMIEDLFQGTKDIFPRRIYPKTKDVPDGYVEMDKILGIIGETMPDNYLGFTQYLRELELTPAGQAQFSAILSENFHRIDLDTFYSRELAEPTSGGGLATVVKRWSAPGFDPADVGAVKALSKPPDRYFIFKTHDPAQFSPGLTDVSKTAVENYARHTGRIPGGGSPDTAEEAVDLAKRLKLDYKDPKVIQELLDRSTSGKADIRESTVWHLSVLESLMNALEPALNGAVLAGPKANLKINAKTGLVDARFAITKFFDDMFPHVGAGRAETKEQLQALGFEIRDKFGPARGELHRTPRGTGISVIAEQFMGQSRAKADEILNGVVKKLAPGSNFIKKSIVKAPEREGGLIPELRELFREGKGEEFWQAVRGALDPETALKEGIDARVVAFLRKINAVDEQSSAEVLMTRFAGGFYNKFVPKKFHYMLSRTWVGDHRLPIYIANDLAPNQPHRVIGFASGHNPQEALSEAREIADFLNAKIARGEILDSVGEPLRVKVAEYAIKGEAPGMHGRLDSQPHAKTIADRQPRAEAGVQIAGGRLQDTRYSEDLYQYAAQIPDRIDDPLVDHALRARAQLMSQDPTRWQTRKGAHGFVGQRKPLTFEQAREMLTANVHETYNVLQRDAISTLLMHDLQRLHAEDSKAAVRLVDRLNNRLGVEGPLNRYLNKSLDKILSPLFGARGGAKAVHAFNELTYFLTLGAFDMGFAVVNATTPLQTGVGEMMLVTRTPINRLGGYYGHGHFKHSDGTLRPFSYVDGAQTMKKGWQTLTNPSALELEMLEKATREGHIARPMMEEVVGQDSRAARAIMSGRLDDPEAGFFTNLKRAMQAPVAMSEEFSRAYSFALGWRLGTDFHNMPPEVAYSFAAKFTQRTNYGYASADRAKYLTGYLGTGFGLFKNWTNNYMLNFGTYSKEAFHGNFAPLLTMMAGTGSVGGLMAVPGFGIADSLLEYTTNKDLVEWTYDLVGGDRSGDGTPYTANTIMYGLPSLLGISLQGRAAPPGASLLRDATMMINTVHMDRAAALGGVISTSLDLAQAGINPYGSERLSRELVRAFMPRTVQRWYGIAAADGLHSLQTGNRIMPGPGMLKSTLYVLGITPLEIEQQMDANNELYEDTDKLRKKIAFYGELGADALQRGDWGTYTEVVRRAYAQQIPIESLSSSMHTRINKGQTDLAPRQFGNKSRQMLRDRGLLD